MASRFITVYQIQMCIPKAVRLRKNEVLKSGICGITFSVFLNPSKCRLLQCK